MKVILNKDVKGLGKKFQTVEVSEGYARNYLLPKNIASSVDNENSNDAKNKLESIKYKKNIELEKAKENKVILEKSKLEFKCKVGESNKLFGSVTEKEIASKIKEIYNIDVDKKKIKLDESIKELGVYTASIKVYEDIIAKINVNVVRM